MTAIILDESCQKTFMHVVLWYEHVVTLSTSCVDLGAGGNWKCNGSLESVNTLLDVLEESIPSSSGVDVLIAPAFVHLPLVVQKAGKCMVAAQNCGAFGNGAYTGEVSADMLQDMGIQWVILGHSERRHVVAHESDEMIASKTKYAQSKGLSVVFCVGETLEEREAGKTFEVLERQIQALSEAVSLGETPTDIVLAYEPVWAIGTGKVATPEQAQEVHHHVRSWVKTHVSEKAAESMRIIYGGSVNASNCQDLATMDDIDGFLVGGASLKPEFVNIVQSGMV